VTHWAVILAGGVGSRFWPLSTPHRPKQLLPLVDADPLLVDTVRRLTPLVPSEQTLIVTNSALVDSVRTLLPALPPENVIAEPRSAGTAPALAWAAAEIERRGGPDAMMLCVHADWAIGQPEAFRATLQRAADTAARHRGLVTVGVVPSRPDPGFGYIQPAEPVDGARRVARFVEKPDRATAARMVDEGYLWNSGIFVWCAGDFLDEIRRHTPEVAPALECAATADIARFFTEVTPISVDNGVLERSERVLVLPGDFEWDDVGTWAALRRVRTLDAGGNAVAGPAHLVEARANVVHSEGSTVVLYGVSDLVVVTRDGLTLVTTVERAADLKKLLDALPASVRDAP
jgi:mannose-1-phosphate guanylyltransferase